MAKDGKELRHLAYGLTVTALGFGMVVYLGRPATTVTWPKADQPIVAKPTDVPTKLPNVRQSLKEPRNTAWKDYIKERTTEMDPFIGRRQDIEAILCDPEDVSLLGHLQRALKKSRHEDLFDIVMSHATDYLKDKSAPYEVLPVTAKTAALKIPQVIVLTRDVVTLECVKNDADMRGLIRYLCATAQKNYDGIVADGFAFTNQELQQTGLDLFAGMRDMEAAHVELKQGLCGAPSGVSDDYLAFMMGLYCDAETKAQENATMDGAATLSRFKATHNGLLICHGAKSGTYDATWTVGDQRVMRSFKSEQSTRKIIDDGF